MLLGVMVNGTNCCIVDPVRELPQAFLSRAGYHPDGLNLGVAWLAIQLTNLLLVVLFDVT